MGTLNLNPLPPEAAAKYIPSRPGIRAYNRIETLPGLQTLTLQTFEDAQNSTKLIDVIQENGIEPLLKWARAVVPSSVRKKTPICLFASAGVRGKLLGASFGSYFTFRDGSNTFGGTNPCHPFHLGSIGLQVQSSMHRGDHWE